MARRAAQRFAFVVAIAALALTGTPSAAEPQGFPGKPVRIIVPYKARPMTSWRGCWRSSCKASSASQS